MMQINERINAIEVRKAAIECLKELETNASSIKEKVNDVIWNFSSLFSFDFIPDEGDKTHNEIEVIFKEVYSIIENPVDNSLSMYKYCLERIINYLNSKELKN